MTSIREAPAPERAPAADEAQGPGPPVRRMDDLYSRLEPRLRELRDFVVALPGAPESFVRKYEVLADPRLGRKRLQLLQYELEVAKFDVKGHVVLDAGAGTGLYSVLFAFMGAARVEAIDFFPQNVEFLRKLADEFDLAIAPRKADIANTGLPDGSVGFIYCTEAISHFRDWGAFLDESARVLKGGGRIVIADGNNGANPRIVHGIHDFWEESEVGPFTAARFPRGKNLPYIFRRWRLIARHFPQATDDEVFHLGLLTANRGGEDLMEACRGYFDHGVWPAGSYARGVSQHRPEDGQRNEEPIDPDAIVRRLRTRGLEAHARAHFGFSANPLLPMLNEVASRLGRVPLTLADRYLVIASRP